MKMLWVEDFGGRLAPSKIAAELFQDVLRPISLIKVLKPGKANVVRQLPELFEQHSVHRIFICKSFLDWKKVYEEQDGDFDVALIDISLEASRTPVDLMPDGIESREFDKRAGFYIYHKLIKQGFPENNIAFFTGQAQSLEDFSTYCGEIFLDLPKYCFEKDSVQFPKLRQWLTERVNREDLILRRGIIEGCRFMKAKVEAIDQAQLESRLIFYKTTGKDVNGDPETFRRETIDYLSRLERFFTSYRTSDRDYWPWLFLRELAAKWEGSSGYVYRGKQFPRFETKFEERFYTTSQFQMKLLRNWTEHNLLSPELTAKDLAYFFMLALRSWVGEDLKEVFFYEQILATLFDRTAVATPATRVKLGLDYQLEKSYSRLNALYLEMKKQVPETVETRRHDNHFLEEFRAVGDLVDVIRRDEGLRPAYEFYRQRVQEQSLRLSYESFWHGLFPLYLGKPLYANLQTVGFNLEPLPESFLSFLARLIRPECFLEDDLKANVA